MISFTKDELLNIRQNTPQNLLPDFDYSDVLLDIVVGGAVALVKRFRTRKRGKRAGALVKLRQRGLRMPLPSIHLANLRSLHNKMDKLLLLSRTNKDFSNSAALCFTETWLNDAIRTACYICLTSSWSEHFNKGDFNKALGDFNKANLSRELPKYRQHITCPTRDSNILDHCYTVIKDAYHSVPRAALGLSDHGLVHLIPTYRQKLKSAKPVLRTVKRWTNEAA